jgi:hypothetical protein
MWNDPAARGTGIAFSPVLGGQLPTWMKNSEGSGHTDTVVEKPAKMEAPFFLMRGIVAGLMNGFGEYWTCADGVYLPRCLLQ